jgi:hypothetical protein
MRCLQFRLSPGVMHVGRPDLSLCPSQARFGSFVANHLGLLEGHPMRRLIGHWPPALALARPRDIDFSLRRGDVVLPPIHRPGYRNKILYSMSRSPGNHVG